MASPENVRPNIPGCITNEKERIYDTREISSDFSQPHATPYELLNDALGADIKTFAVEFLPFDALKQIVSFRFDFAPSVSLKERHVVGARVFMEIAHETDGWGVGACKIQLCNYLGYTPGTVVAFRFHIQEAFTLRRLMNLIKGIDHNPEVQAQGDLTNFYFVHRDHSDHGRRDWIAQVFVRAYKAGLVGWKVKAVLGPKHKVHEKIPANKLPCRYDAHSTQIKWNVAGFNDMIGNFYFQPTSDRPIQYCESAMEKGHFWFFERDWEGGLPYRRPALPRVLAGPA
ncbi:hypothetical protein B0J18DRAFT_453720 [Chaetomium sp. MPI-SDFR-AT-0129]|nr:hypothetical protein B0J18DRAFT_453720 [Chaetomium sp. MPI-SDFR-AT-0129]